MSEQAKQFKLKLPADIDQWIEQGAEKSLRSKSAEIVYLLREKMENEKAEARS
jgi:hypothetical protein